MGRKHIEFFICMCIWVYGKANAHAAKKDVLTYISEEQLLPTTSKLFTNFASKLHKKYGLQVEISKSQGMLPANGNDSFFIFVKEYCRRYARLHYVKKSDLF